MHKVAVNKHPIYSDECKKFITAKLLSAKKTTCKVLNKNAYTCIQTTAKMDSMKM